MKEERLWQKREREAKDDVLTHRTLSKGIAEQLFHDLFYKVLQKNAMSTQNIKKRGLMPPHKAGTYMLKAVEQAREEAATIPEAERSLT